MVTPVESRPEPARHLSFVRDEPSSATQPISFPRSAWGPLLAAAVVAAAVVRQLASSTATAAPATDSEAAVGANAYALLTSSDFGVPQPLSDQAAAWQLTAYSYLTASFDRHESLVGSTREFVVLLTALTAVLTVAVARRMLLGWGSTAAAVAISGVPAVAALARIISVPATLAAFWLTVAALAAVIAADQHGRRATQRTVGVPGRVTLRTWGLVAISATASVAAVLSSGVAAVVILGVVLGFASFRALGQSWNGTLRGLAILDLAGCLVGVLWVTVFGAPPATPITPAIEVAGPAVALGGLVVAAASWPIPWLRPLALGAAPVLVAAAWPGPAQASSLLLGLTAAAVLAAGLVDTVLGPDQSGFLPSRRFPAAARSAGVGLLIAGTVGALLLPASASATATATPGPEVASWIETELAQDAVIEVDPLSRAQLVRDGLNPDRLSTAGQGGEEAEFVLVPLDTRTELPLLASFGAGADAFAVRLVVDDPIAYAGGQSEDLAARRRFGAALADNPNLSLAGPARATLLAGQVDARLMITLAAATASVRLVIREFTGTPGDLVQGNVFRTVTLTEITDLDPPVGASGTSDGAPRWLSQFFRNQLPPYEPSLVLDVVHSLTVRYSAPSPTGLLP